MEPTVLSAPLGHKQWESEQTFPHGFHTLDSDNRGVLCQNTGDRTGLDFRDTDHEQKNYQREEVNDFQAKPVELGSFMNISNFSLGDLQFEPNKSTLISASDHSPSLEELSYIEKTDRTGDNIDADLSWLFPSNLTDVVGKHSASTHLDLTCEKYQEDLEAPCGQDELITLSVPVSPSKVSVGTPETNVGDPFLLVDLLSDEPVCLPTGEFNPLGVSEELIDLSQEDQACLPPSQSSDTWSPETRDKGLFPDQVTDLPVGGRTIAQDLREGCFSENHMSTSAEFFEGSLPLLDSVVPDYDNSLNLFPDSPVSVTPTTVLPHLLTQESGVQQGEAGVISKLASEQQGENESCAVGLSDEPSSQAVTLAEDALIQGDITTECYSLKDEFKDVMEDKICSEAKTQENETMALDLCFTADEVPDHETWDLKALEDLQSRSLPESTAEQTDEYGVTASNMLKESDFHEVTSLEFSVHDLTTSSPEVGWTSEQDVETLSLSKMVVDDSLPMVSADNTREEDVSPLKAVFDALDQDGDGFVRIEEFMEFAAAYGADQVRSLVCFFPQCFPAC